MGDAYPELRARASSASPSAEGRRRSASSRRSTTAWRSSRRRSAARPTARSLDGEIAFKLHDTYGFPLDLTADVCRERGVARRRGRLRRARWTSSASRRARRASSRWRRALEYGGADHAFHGYETLAQRGGTVVALYVDGTPVERADGRRRRRRRARPHAVLRRVAAARSATPASCATPSARAFVRRGHA